MLEGKARAIKQAMALLKTAGVRKLAMLSEWWACWG